MDGKQKVAANKQDSWSSNGEPIALGMSAPGHKSPHSYSAALEEIWRTHSTKILRVTQRITNNREDAEDALQDSFLRAHVHLHDFDGRSSIATWLTRIAINSALMILRKRGGVEQLSIENAAGTEALAILPADCAPSPEAQYAEQERQEIVRSAMETLRPNIRRALELQLEERSGREIAHAMGISVAAVKSRNFHAKSALRQSLQAKLGRRSGATKRLQLSAV